MEKSLENKLVKPTISRIVGNNHNSRNLMNKICLIRFEPYTIETPNTNLKKMNES